MTEFSSDVHDSDCLKHLEGAIVQLTDQVALLADQIEVMQLYSSDSVKFGKLQQLLTNQQWQEADLETTRIIIETSGHPTIDTISPTDIQKFPCQTLRILDQLWSKYSKGRFGFSVKMRLYQEIGGSEDTLRSLDRPIMIAMRKKIGTIQGDRVLTWKEQTFSLAAPEGALPAHWYQSSPYGDKMIAYFCLRLLACGICKGRDTQP
jgi:hypothetical protein